VVERTWNAFRIFLALGGEIKKIWGGIQYIRSVWGGGVEDVDVCGSEGKGSPRDW